MSSLMLFVSSWEAMIIIGFIGIYVVYFQELNGDQSADPRKWSKIVALSEKSDDDR
jgi:hypothetical protein